MQTEKQFFSIIIPAHNEEKYIADTLQHIKDLDYPRDRYEAIIIENGSSDQTPVIAKKYEEGNITFLISTRKGVSIAKNIGIEKRSQRSDWVIFLDADTILERDFLNGLNTFLIDNEGKNLSIGTTEIRPIPQRLIAQAWFAFYDIGHRLTKASYSIQILKNSVIDKFRFDEDMTMGEDLELIQFARRFGKFFFFRTKHVLTSTRRFDKEGWLRIFFSWTFVAVLSTSMKKKFVYKVVR
jgi:glycosyltransferase involved in cell wall biosynthesis